MSDLYTKAELRKFDRLTLLQSSPDQLTRIQARFAVKVFLATHGKAKCDAMFAALTAKGKKRS